MSRGRIDRVVKSEHRPTCLVSVLSDDLVDELGVGIHIRAVGVDVEEQDAVLDEPVVASGGDDATAAVVLADIGPVEVLFKGLR